ncbi:transcriptional regulator with XRE-family HTH domain [Bacilli bacterium PM5-9]|nr:transcriptional regulator with XRE-family HTH domain [Bacilli bacterium PM5-9]
MKKTKEINVQDLAQRIKQKRLDNNFTVEKLSDLTGLSSNYLFAIEGQRKTPSVKSLANIATELYTDVDYLLFGQREKTDISTLTQMLEQLSESERKHAEVILREFVHAVSEKK